MGSGLRWAFEDFSKYVRVGLGFGRRFELLGEGPGEFPPWIAGIFVGVL